MTVKTILAISASAIILSGCFRHKAPETFPPEQITAAGELAARLDRNLDRLESDIYHPGAVFKDDDWPGDFVGRTILGTVLNSRASGRTPLYLQTIIGDLPSHLNERSYLGPVYGGKDEQQLSGHGWLLRGLCEYYGLTGDYSIIPVISGIVYNLFLPDPQMYSSYPIDPEQRSSGNGAESGSIQDEVDGWRLSSDIGCVFIGMSGLIHAYGTLISIPGIDKDLLKGMKDCIERMLGRFREIDPVAIQAQTHATLTACCGLVRYYGITGEKEWLELAEDRWKTYVAEGMTVNFENYNWFGRHDSWTEPCAIIDSYILACDLWRYTLDEGYRNLAELIYYNGICHTQRHNGGFGCDNCPSAGDPYLKIHAYEAYWCCTMRGGEGLARVSESSYMHSGRSLFIPFFRGSELHSEGISLIQTTGYPFQGEAEIRILDNPGGYDRLYLPSAPWMEGMSVEVNGQACRMDGNCLKRTLKAGDCIDIRFNMKEREDEVFNLIRRMRGPLVLADDGQTPLYHLMDSTVTGHDYKRKILY